MAEVLLSVMQKLERRRVDMPEFLKGETQGVINELRRMWDFVRVYNFDLNKTPEGSSYSMRHVVDKAHDVLVVGELNNTFAILKQIKFVRSMLSETNRQVLQMVETIRSENVIGEDDADGGAVGLEGDIKQLLQRAVFGLGKELASVLIKGMVGIGKTTLARRVYDHADVVKRFKHRRAWICVSNELNDKVILVKILQQLADTEEQQIDSFQEKILNLLEDPSLQFVARQLLREMPYFIVFDGCESSSFGSFLRGVFRNEDNGSRLLFTSRSKYIGEANIKYLHDMKTLGSDKSWQLFSKTIFGSNKLTSEKRFPKKLEKKAKKLLMECDGLPLAIKEVGRQLAEKRQSGTEWEQLLDEPIDWGSTFDLLQDFYQRLNPALKTSFLYLSLFKENIIMRTEKLMQIWVAGGVISRYYDTPTSCFKGLLNESIIEIKRRSNEDINENRVRVNAILHKLSIKKAEEEIGLVLLSNNGNDRPSSSHQHHIIKCGREKFNYSTDQDKHLVSLFFRGGGYFDSSPSYWESFERLKILDFEDFGLKILPKTIGKLLELEYLGLRNNYLEELPYSVGFLKKLEVLDIALNFLVEVPNVIWEMSSLKYLYLTDVIVHMPLELSWHLKTLVSMSIDDWKMKIQPTKLSIEEVHRKASVEVLRDQSFWTPNILILRGSRFRNMPSLDGLHISSDLVDLKLDGKLPRLPSDDDFPSGLEHLKMINSCLDEDPMPVLEKMPKLKYLRLRNAYTGQKMVISREGFPCLLNLCIEELWNLRNIQFEEGALHELEILEINNCPYLETIPEEIGSMTKLGRLKMVTTVNIAKKIRNSTLISKIWVVDIYP